MSARAVARKFWELVPRVISAVFAQSRRGEHNLAPNHLRILRALSKGRCSLSELAKAMEVSLPSMSASVQTLVERGWLERSRSQEDRRSVELQVTALGREVLEEEYSRVTGWTANLLSTLNAEDLRKVEEGLEALKHLFDNEVNIQESPPPQGGNKRKTRQTSR